VAATTLAGQALGAGDPRRARRSVFCAIQIAVGVALTGSLVFLAFPRLMLSLFTTDESVIVQGIIPLCILAVGQPIMTIANCLSGGLRGVGDTRSVMWITGIGAWLVRVPLAVLSVTLFSLGLPGVQASMTLDWFTRMALLAWRFRPALWDKHARSAMGRVRLSPRGTPAE